MNETEKSMFCQTTCLISSRKIPKVAVPKKSAIYSIFEYRPLRGAHNSWTRFYISYFANKNFFRQSLNKSNIVNKFLMNSTVYMCVFKICINFQRCSVSKMGEDIFEVQKHLDLWHFRRQYKPTPSRSDSRGNAHYYSSQIFLNFSESCCMQIIRNARSRSDNQLRSLNSP